MDILFNDALPRAVNSSSYRSRYSELAQGETLGRREAEGRGEVTCGPGLVLPIHLGVHDRTSRRVVPPQAHDTPFQIGVQAGKVSTLYKVSRKRRRGSAVGGRTTGRNFGVALPARMKGLVT